MRTGQTRIGKPLYQFSPVIEMHDLCLERPRIIAFEFHKSLQTGLPEQNQEHQQPGRQNAMATGRRISFREASVIPAQQALRSRQAFATAPTAVAASISPRP